MTFWLKHKRTIRNAILVLVLALASPYLFVFGIIAQDSIIEYSQRTAFNSTHWKSPDHKNYKSPKYAIRIRMVDDLFKRHKLVGMTRKEVIQLLGSDGHNEGDFSYWLGPERGWISMDSESLAIEFDDKNRVKKAYVWRD